ncbi:kinesin-like protein 10A isoform X2 [Arctopsyche grandis]|uniref:kinesin-like protein 10A isoform X2 n=1 Tax=Arctopsyche grandis TaxID=121162 RepID=UPI00406D7930
MENAFLIPSGANVNIKRTDGRIHSALVSGVDLESRTVTVEWFERGETKGKSVEIDAIFALNPELCLHPLPANSPNSPMPNKLTRDMTRQSIPVFTKGTNRTNLNNQMRPSVVISNGHGGDTTGRRGTENVPPAQSSSNSRLTTNQLRSVNQSSHIGSVRPGPSATQSNSAINNNVGSTAGAPKRSNVVKEVEKLKENREKRRQHQAEKKQEKEALMNADPGNPNWEFLAMIRDYQSTVEFRPLRGNESVEDHQITVCVRKRPLNKKEVNRKEVDVISVPSKDQMVVHEPRNKVDLTKYLENQHFRFDYAFDESCSNDMVYKYTAKPLVQTIFDGGMATCFAYGQTGSGKTHTMGGDFNGRTQDCKKGIYAMAARDVFIYLTSPKYKPMNFIVSASFFEIYSGKVFDLLADKAKLRVLEDGKQQVQIVGLTEKVVDNVDEVLKLIQHGNTARTSGQTSANSNSSRSHAVFQIMVRTPGTHKVHGKFSLIDLAGNERGADTSSANRQTRMEGAEINKSLLALKECIRALGMKGAHLPFRASKLTQVLRDSFIGDKSRTCMIAMISPGLSSCEHSLNTLRYADRVKELAANDPSGRQESGGRMDALNDVDMEGSYRQETDLAQLRSLNEGDMSADLLTFHEAISALQLAEEEVLDNHKALFEYMNHGQTRSIQLLNMTRDVDYDQDAYARQWEDLLQEQLRVLSQSRDLVAEFRSKLANEEHLSRNIQPSNAR